MIHLSVKELISNSSDNSSWLVLYQAIIASDNGLSPGGHQAILLLIRILGTNFTEILSEINTFSL